MFNTCLVSDSAMLVIRGMKRLHHFVTSCAMTIWFLPFMTSVIYKQCSYDCWYNSMWQTAFRTNGFAMVFVSVVWFRSRNQKLGQSCRNIWFISTQTKFSQGGIPVSISILSLWFVKASFINSSFLLNLYSPQYAESALYAGKWMIRMLVPKLGSGKLASIPQIKGIVKDEFEALVDVYLRKEAQETNNGSSPGLQNLQKYLHSRLH